MSNAAHSKQVVVNQHFKTWLIHLDPMARVRNMSSIAKTQWSAGLRGSLIKSSLAQLSQSCEVKLVRLSEKEIKQHSRRNLVKYLVDSTGTSENQVKNESGKPKFIKLSNSNLDKNIISRDNTSKRKENGYLNNKMTDEKLTLCGSSPVKNQTPFKNNKSHTKLVSIKKKSNQNTKLKRKLRECFGDEIDDLTGTVNVVEELTNDNGNNCDKNIKSFHSTTVNVNIYNSSIDNKTGIDKTTVKRKSHTENSLLNTDKSSDKRLRIDVSLSNGKSCVTNNNTISSTLESKKRVSEKSHKSKSKKKLAQNLTKENIETKSKSYLHKAAKSNITLSDANTNSPEEDPSIKELWSIFGMESPTDRSESIIKSYPLLSDGDTITLHKAPLENNSTLSNPSLVKPGETLYTNSCTNNSLVVSEKEKSTTLTSTDEGEINETILSEKVLTHEVEPVCKISETFSLAQVPPEVHGLFNQNSSSPGKQNSIDKNRSLPENPLIKDIDKQCSSFERNSSVIETIQILDDPVCGDKPYETPKLSSNIREEENEKVEKYNKVGSIRVKSLGSLMSPQLFKEPQNANEPTVAATNKIPTPRSTQVANVQHTQPDQQENLARIDSIEEPFLQTYKFYFNEQVESKISKLGDLLNLAVADGIRRSERIKRAEQLSSDDVIKEERQRAEKDFSDMMKIRGNEFSPLCEVILKTFEPNSKITLFIALFCRILIHAEQIDPVNKSQMLEARNVVLAMLSKHQFKDKEVLEFLQSEPEQLKIQVELVRNWVETFLNSNNKMKNYSPIEVDTLPSNKTPSTNAFKLPIVKNLHNIMKKNNLEITSSSINSGTIQLAPNQIFPKGSLQNHGTQHSVLVRKIPANAIKINSKLNTVFNNALPNSSGILQISPEQISSTTSCPVTIVGLPQTSPLPVQPVSMGLRTQMNNSVNDSSSALQAIISQKQLTNSPNSIEDPTCISMNLLPQISINPHTPQCRKTAGTVVPHQPRHVVLKMIEPELTSVNIQRKRHVPIIIRNISRSSSPAIIGLDPNNVYTTNPNSTGSQTQLTSAIAVSTNSNFVTCPAINEAITTVTNSRSIQHVPTPNESSTGTLSSNLPITSAVQTQVPSSSHCHPFVKRMPIAGKMKMFFGHSNIKS